MRSLKTGIRFLVLAAAAMMVTQCPVVAQSIQGSIIGTVRDKSEALVPDASVTLTDVDKGITRNAITDGHGDYHFIDVPAGHYKLVVSAAGFQGWQITGVTLSVHQDLRVDASLQVGNVQQAVEVSASSEPAINTDDASVSAVYNSTSISNLPTNTRASQSGTSALNVVGTLPGVQADNAGSSSPGFSLQGGLPFQTEVSVDGITVQSATGNSPIGNAFPSSESISEMRADGVQNDAEYGQPGEITVTTKGGTNTPHGSLFWYHQNAAFDAIPYAYPTTLKKNKLVANTFGGSFGGPVVIPHFYNGHDRTFIFGTYEGWRYPNSGTYNYMVPTAAMKKGDFSQYTASGYSGQLFDPSTGSTYGTALPSISPITQKFLQFFPDPNIGNTAAFDDNGAQNYQINKDQSQSSNQFDVRADQYFGSNQKFLLWGRYTWKNQSSINPQTLLVPASTGTGNSRVLKVSANYTITPNVIDEFSFGYTRYQTGNVNPFNGTAFTNGLGLNGLQNLFYNGLPEIDYSSSLTNFAPDRLNSVSQSNTYDYYNTLSWSHGKHQMKFGVDAQSLQAITPLGFNGADNYGTFSFQSSQGGGIFTGVDFADLLLGLPYQTFYDVVSQDNDGQSWHYHAFAQDQWAVTPSLTLTYGIRYELHPSYHDAHGDIANFDPNYAKSGAVIYPDGFSNLISLPFMQSANACLPYGSSSGSTINGAPCMPVLSASQAGFPSGLKHYPKLRFMPRFGFAWRPSSDNKTAIRGGFGMYNITLLGGNFYSLTGTVQADTTQYSNTYNSTTHAIGYQWPSIYAGSGSAGCTTCYGQNYFGTANSINWKDPYTYQWSLSVDRALSHGYAVRLSYIGSVTQHLVWAPDENALPFSTTVSAYNQPLSARRFPNWGTINTRDTGAYSNYNSGQIEVSHRYSAGLQLDSSYTFAKAMADNQGPASNSGFAGETGGSRATSILMPSIDYGNVYGTRRHLWNTTMVYDLPFGRGRTFGSSMSRLADMVVGGWQISNILLMETGPYLSPYIPGGQSDPSGTGSGISSDANGNALTGRNQYPDKVQGVSIKPSSRTRLHWLNPAALTCPGQPGWTSGSSCTTGNGKAGSPAPIGRFGNAGAGSIEGPNYINLSSGLTKSFTLVEGVKLQLQGTFTNVLNHTNLSNPNLNITSAKFGQITGSQGARTGQISARLTF
ncbi:hypothetical protein GCM10011507_14360 [Edaphobacter acidisoli]|uniref:TonB-dependent transporter Oar-like beta-barrel domain-containing protein n=2 Tax=Edaphobacter acidisoli TaxID=2040573 RepID=A0A916RPV9_9BACT|nr:TonB-dependent receptor [Edaphobacter acidisoli]GGA63883.1 hypothetical protein GCM10011507_14360 [Edaphobacter acidisoli]